MCDSGKPDLSSCRQAGSNPFQTDSTKTLEEMISGGGDGVEIQNKKAIVNSVRIDRYHMTVAAYLILIQDENVLLLRRYNTGYEDGNYSLIAGHLDGGETVQQAICREAEEEGKILINPTSISIAHAMHRRGEGRERIDYFCTTADWNGEPAIGEPHKCDDLSWFRHNDLPSNTIPYIKQALLHVKNKVPFSHFGFE